MEFVKVRSTSHADALAQLDALGDGNEALREGVAELREVLELVRALGVPETHYALNFSIARGLDYYTGTVYETTLNDYPQIGSICSGGRYEDLASHYTKSKLPGVGISIGLTRLFWQLREAGLLGATAGSTVQALVTQMDGAALPHCLAVASDLRRAGFNTEVVMEASKLAKQFKYADRAGIRFVVVLGEDEIAKGTVTVKDLRREDQFQVLAHELASALAGRAGTGRTYCQEHARMKPIRLDGRSLTRAQLVAVAHGAHVELAAEQLPAVQRAADFLAEQVAPRRTDLRRITGFGSNADKLLGAHRLRDQLPGAEQSRKRCHEELQRNLIVTHAVCVGEAVRAGNRARDAVHPHQHADARAFRHPRRDPAGTDGDAQRRHRAGGARSWARSALAATWRRCRTWPSFCWAAAKRSTTANGCRAPRRSGVPGLQPVTLSYKEGLALNNGTAQMLACGVLALSQLEACSTPPISPRR